MDGLRRFLSHFWPIPAQRIDGPRGPLHVVWENGRPVVNSARANQSYGSLHRVWQLCFADMGIAERRPERVLLLGFGAGSAATILRRELDLPCPITGVDNDPRMLALARGTFQVDALGGLDLIEQDAHAFVATHDRSYPLVVVDLFHELDLAAGIETEAFIAGLRRCTAPGGLLCFNTVVHDAPSRSRSQLVGANLARAFATVDEHRYERLNRVFTAR